MQNRIIRSLVSGELNERRVIVNASGTTAVGSPPSATENGISLQSCEMLHLYPKVAGAAPSFTLQLHYYSEISESWHKAASTITIADDQIVQVNTNGERRVFFEITAEAAAADEIQLWAGYNTPSAS